MKNIIMLLMLLCLWLIVPVSAQPSPVVQTDSTAQVDTLMSDSLLSDSLVADSLVALTDADLGADEATAEGGGLHKHLKRMFVDGSVGFMSLVALALVLGLALCIERVIFLTLSDINSRRLMQDIDSKLANDDVEGAKTLCRNTRGPVASICYQGLLHIQDSVEQIDRQLTNYGSVQISNMEKGCSWIRLFIAVAPSLGFLGTVIGMVMAFDQIQTAGDISPTIVAKGMKVALITTIFGIIAAVILQFFYNYVISKIERLTLQMEESAITFLDSVTQYKARNHGGSR